MLKYNVEKRKLKDLIPYKKNPRHMGDKVFDELTDSLEKYGLAQLPVINTDNTILGGNQRCKSLIKTHGPDYEIDVLIPERELDQKEAYELCVRLNLHKGEFIVDMLKTNPDYNPSELLDWGFEHYQLGIQNQPINVVTPIPKPNFTPKESAAGSEQVEQPAPSGEGIGTKHLDMGSQKLTQAQESIFSVEFHLSKSVRDKFYTLLRKIKDKHNVDTTPEAVEIMMNFYDINHPE